MDKLNATLKEYYTSIQNKLPSFLPTETSPHQILSDAMAYSVMNGGKRIRGTLVLAFCQLFSGEVSCAMPFATALEMVHAYSLIHDDLPCMDDDDMRRGKPSCHIQFGEATALLAGDALLTLAFETITSPTAIGNIGAQKIVKCVNILAKAAGNNGMIGGQIMDLANESKEVTQEILALTDSKKTGALICAAVEIGCVLGDAKSNEIELAVSYAEKIGMVFQIVDDILDCTADEKLLGKPVHSDAQQNKQTFASVFGIEKSRNMAERLTREAVETIRKTGKNTEFLCKLAQMLSSRQY